MVDNNNLLKLYFWLHPFPFLRICLDFIWIKSIEIYTQSGRGFSSTRPTELCIPTQKPKIDRTTQISRMNNDVFCYCALQYYFLLPLLLVSRISGYFWLCLFLRNLSHLFLIRIRPTICMLNCMLFQYDNLRIEILIGLHLPIRSLFAERITIFTRHKYLPKSFPVIQFDA